jgi:competence protein ComGF
VVEMVTLPEFTIEHITNTIVEDYRWGLINLRAVITYRIEIKDFELIPESTQKSTQEFKEFEELLRLSDKYYKSIEHIKVLLYGKNKEGKIIAITLIKDNTKDPPNLAIIAYNFEKMLNELREWAYHKIRQQQDP